MPTGNEVQAGIYVRHKGPCGAGRKMGPLDREMGCCFACGESMAVGDFVTLVPLGPGDDEEQQQKAAEGRFYNSTAIAVHWACSGPPKEEKNADG